MKMCTWLCTTQGVFLWPTIKLTSQSKLGLARKSILFASLNVIFIILVYIHVRFISIQKYCIAIHNQYLMHHTILGTDEFSGIRIKKRQFIHLWEIVNWQFVDLDLHAHSLKCGLSIHFVYKGVTKVFNTSKLFPLKSSVEYTF